MSIISITIYIVLSIVISYLIGSVSFAVIISKLFTNKDIRTMGSGNAGMTNVVRVIGAKAGVITFILDCLKGFAVCMISKSIVFENIFKQTSNAWFSPVYWAYICGFFCVLGHMYPVFFKFHGGKGVSTTAGILIACNPVVLAIGFCFFLIAFIISRTVSVSSLSAAVGIILGTVFFYEKTGLKNTRLIQVLFILLITAIIVLKHKDNIDRIAKGKEQPLVIHKEDN